MASKTGRKNGYFGDPAGLLVKCLLNLLIRREMATHPERKQAQHKSHVLEQFKHLVPEYNSLLRRPVEDNALWGRAWTGVLATKISEHPDKQPAALRYMPAAQVILKAGVPVDRARFTALLGEAAVKEQPLISEDTLDSLLGVAKGLGSFYIMKTTLKELSGYCCAGRSINGGDWRSKAFKKGDLTCTLAVFEQLWFSESDLLQFDKAALKALGPWHLGHERYSLSAETVFEMMVNLAVKLNLEFRRVVHNK